MSKFDAIFADVPDPQATATSIDNDEELALYSEPRNEKSEQLLNLRAEQVDGLERRVSHFKSMYALRRNVAWFIFALIFIWLVCVMGLVFLGSYEVYYLKGNCNSYELYSWHQKIRALPDGCAYIKRSNFLNLSESIVIALITTTTANVLGLFYIVAKWLFPKSVNDSDDVSTVAQP